MKQTINTYAVRLVLAVLSCSIMLEANTTVENQLSDNQPYEQLPKILSDNNDKDVEIVLVSLDEDSELSSETYSKCHYIANQICCTIGCISASTGGLLLTTGFLGIMTGFILLTMHEPLDISPVIGGITIGSSLATCLAGSACFGSGTLCCNNVNEDLPFSNPKY